MFGLEEGAWSMGIAWRGVGCVLLTILFVIWGIRQVWKKEPWYLGMKEWKRNNRGQSKSVRVCSNPVNGDMVMMAVETDRVAERAMADNQDCASCKYYDRCNSLFRDKIMEIRGTELCNVLFEQIMGVDPMKAMDTLRKVVEERIKTFSPEKKAEDSASAEPLSTSLDKSKEAFKACSYSTLCEGRGLKAQEGEDEYVSMDKGRGGCERCD
jgi:hypothetical protein